MLGRTTPLLVLLSTWALLAACGVEPWQENIYITGGKSDTVPEVRRVAQRVVAGVVEVDIAVQNLNYQKVVGVHGALDGGPWKDYQGGYVQGRSDGTELWRVTVTPSAGWKQLRYAVFYLDVPTGKKYWDNNNWADYKAGAESKVAYAHVKPPGGWIAPSLRGDTWLQHFAKEIKPYWTMAAAKGSPEGNFPTWRGMDGSLQGPTLRRPRMLSRQVYLYAAGYMLTGDEALLRLARKGADYLLAHAIDKQHGGCHELLDASGKPQGQGPKYAQDLAYCMMGPAAYYFVTRDPKMEQALLKTRDLLFSKYWDAAKGRMRDGMSHSLGQEVDQGNDWGWELVAQLDQINAFMLLVQPVLSKKQRRDQMLQDMRKLAKAMIDHFWADGIFWGIHNKKWQYQGRHSDFGHTLKTYWMILQIDKRLSDHPFGAFVGKHAHAWVGKAYDPAFGLWGRRMTGADKVQYGSDWWAYAEADQTAATLNLLDYRHTSRLAKTQQGWLDHYVDKAHGEVYPTLNRNGTRTWSWSATDTAKCNDWKNGYHSAEHTLIMYLLGRNLEGKPAGLHFAVPPSAKASFLARPYLFLGKETGRQDLGQISVAGQTLSKVRVTFDELY